MRTVVAVLSALALAALGAFAGMPAMSNGGFLEGREFFGLVAIGALCFGLYAAVSRPQAQRSVLVWVQAAVVGLGAPFFVLLAPLVYCIAVQTGKSCM
jgi:hypothetical protein